MKNKQNFGSITFHRLKKVEVLEGKVFYFSFDDGEIYLDIPDDLINLLLTTKNLTKLKILSETEGKKRKNIE